MKQVVAATLLVLCSASLICGVPPGMRCDQHCIDVAGVLMLLVMSTLVLNGSEFLFFLNLSGIRRLWDAGWYSGVAVV